MKKVLFSAVILMAVANASFARENKTTQEDTYTYYVVGVSGSDYLLSTSPSPLCDQGTAVPCEIVTTEEHSDLQISISEANNPGLTTIVSKRPAF
ncbi:hypothetical protein [Taibaiella chishuiensis]|uniref:DUF4333 domain-containing protein n=1 Tax=Taibaiella chishuiensis TaxID=1434707 RepID=A0A2P8D0X5_9BACT|nr:hypothetical protein [Taibaiella chishuiensis]PSK90806.1 hypothetical protein B0I18_107218 [Taibaiella chishuiensis]